MKITVEPSFRVYNDEDGDYYEVRPDADGLGCVEVVYNAGGPNDKDQAPGPMSPEMAVAVSDCIVKIAKFRQDNPL